MLTAVTHAGLGPGALHCQRRVLHFGDGILLASWTCHRSQPCCCAAKCAFLMCCLWPLCLGVSVHRRLKEGGKQPPPGWPKSGALSYHNVTASYRPGLPPVLRDLTFNLQPGTSCGVVGRTGLCSYYVVFEGYRGGRTPHRLATHNSAD
jgi:hypothetical protein